MFELLGIPPQVLLDQLLIGIINVSFYALLSLGLAVIFGILSIVSFAHGAQYMMGAFAAYFLLQWGIGSWMALILAPILVEITGVMIERVFLQRLYHLDHLYGLLLTFGFALIIQGFFRHRYGSSRLPYPMPDLLSGGQNLDFMYPPHYWAWVVIVSLIVCFSTWLLIEKTASVPIFAQQQRIQPLSRPSASMYRAL